MKIDYNIVVCVANIDAAYDMNVLNNFLFLLRSCTPFLPSFLKFVFTIQSSGDTDRICQVLGTSTIIQVKEHELLESSAKAILDSVLRNAKIPDQTKRIEYFEKYISSSNNSFSNLIFKCRHID